MQPDDESPLTFPCEFPIKAMGRASYEFDSHVASIVRRHVDDLSEGAIRTRSSRDGNYVSVTITVQAKSREQLDAISMDLTASEHIIMVL
jgi:putative lipoic acid-binding regulatory protein